MLPLDLMQKQNTALSLPYCPMISKLSRVRCVGNTRGKPRCNFSSRCLLYLIRDEPLQKWWWVEGGGKETKLKCPPQKIQANDGPARQTLLRHKNSRVAARARDSRARFHMYTGYKYPANWKRSWEVKMPSLKLQNACILAINYAQIF